MGTGTEMIVGQTEIEHPPAGSEGEFILMLSSSISLYYPAARHAAIIIHWPLVVPGSEKYARLQLNGGLDVGKYCSCSADSAHKSGCWHCRIATRL